MFQYPIENILANKMEFGMQMNQQTSTVDDWYFWEYEIYTDILNKKNEKLRIEEEKRRKEEASKKNLPTNNVGNIMSKFKVPSFKS